MAEKESLSQEYRYYAIIRSVLPKERPLAVAREWEGADGLPRAETYTRNLRWENSTRLIRIRESRDDDDAELITENDVEQFIARMTESIRRDEQG